ncbi:hypothetical protein KJ671_03445, partial [Patescibacteria group bacterium]|nr:hypothetical protein [Patescibacteria group bacterium]
MAIHDFALILRADPQIDYNRHFTITQPSLDRLTSLFKETVEVVVRSKEEISGALERFKDRNIDLLYLGGHGRYDGKAIRLSPNCYLEDKDLERSWFDNVSKVVLHACRVGENFAKQICDITDKPISIIGSTDDIYNMKVNVFNREFPIIFSNRPEAFDNPFLQFFNNSTFIATNDKLLDDYIEKKVDLLRYVKNKEMEKTIKSFKVMSDYFFSRYMSVEEAQENLEIAENILE